MIELKNWLIRLNCTCKEIEVVFYKLDEWMYKSSPLWGDYHSTIACRLLVLDKILAVRPVGIAEWFQPQMIKIN